MKPFSLAAIAILCLLGTLICDGFALNEDFITIRIMIDTGSSMYENGEIERLAVALPVHLERLIRGDEAYEGLPPFTRVLVEAFCTKGQEVLIQSRLVYRVGDPASPNFRDISFSSRVTRFRDENSDLNLLINKHLWPAAGGMGNTIALIVSNSRRRPVVPQNLVNAMTQAGSSVIIARIPRALEGNQLAIEIDRELTRAAIQVRETLKLWRKAVFWEIAPREPGIPLMQGEGRSFIFRVENRADVPINYIAAKIRKIEGYSGNYLLRGGAIEAVPPRSRREGELTVTLQDPVKQDAEVGIEFYASLLTDISMKAEPQKVVIPMKVVARRILPQARFTVSPATGRVPLRVTFKNLSSNATEYLWSFGDGAEQSGIRSPIHEYKSPGVFIPTLKVRNEYGDEDVATSTVIVFSAVSLVASFDATPLTGEAPLEVRFANQSQNATSIEWDFGDGSPRLTNVFNPSRIYRYPGEYAVKLTAVGEGGASASAIKIIRVIEPGKKKPVAKFNVSTNQGTAPLTVRFFNRSENADEFEWNFGDGSPTLKARDPVYTYQQPGAFTVTLVAKKGGEQSETREIIQVAPQIPPQSPPQKRIEPRFSMSSGGRDLPLEESGFYLVKEGDLIEFNNQTKNATSFIWDFGDGTISREKSPKHVYESVGEFTVTMTALDESGGKAIYRAAVRVERAGELLLPLILLFIIALLGGSFALVRWVTRPRLMIRVVRAGSDEPAQAFGMWSRVMPITGLAKPLECKAVREDDLWKVRFRCREGCVLERIPSRAPIVLEPRQWSETCEEGEYIIQGYHDTRLKIVSEE